MLSESADGWVLYDDEGRTAALRGSLNTVLLDAAKVMRERGDPVHGGWTVVPDAEVQTLRFIPRQGAGFHLRRRFTPPYVRDRADFSNESMTRAAKPEPSPTELSPNFLGAVLKASSGCQFG